MNYPLARIDVWGTTDQDIVREFVSGIAGACTITIAHDPSGWLTAGNQIEVKSIGMNPRTYTTVAPLPTTAPWTIRVSEAIGVADIELGAKVSRVPTDTRIYSGTVSVRESDASREFSFTIPEDYDWVVDDYSSAQLLRRGSRVRVTVAEDGNLDGTLTQVIFDGYVWSYNVSDGKDGIRRTFTCRDIMASTRSVGLRASRSTRMLMYQDTFDNGDFVDDFVVQLPDNGEEYVPSGMIYLSAYLPGAAETDDILYEYPPNEFVYDAGTQQVSFHFSQSDYRLDGHVWTFRLYYYDPTDNSNTVTRALFDIITGEPWSTTGGLGINDTLVTTVAAVTDTTHFTLTEVDAADLWDFIRIEPAAGGSFLVHVIAKDGASELTVDTVVTGVAPGDAVTSYKPACNLAPIMGFDGGGITSDTWGYYYTAGTHRKLQTLLTEKTDGPVIEILDSLRDSGMLPRAYWLRHDPEAGKVIGRYNMQDAAAVITIDNNLIFDDAMPYSLEGIAGRVECHSQAMSPRNWALGAVAEDGTHYPSVTFNVPVHPDIGAYAASPALPAPGVVWIGSDGKSGTFQQFWQDINSLDVAPCGSDEDCIVINYGQPRWIAEIAFRGTHPQEDTGGGAFIDIPIYFISRMPKITVSGSLDPISATNPGVPMSPELIAVEYDPTNVGRNDGMEFRIACDTIQHVQYVALRWEQDFFYRRDGNNIGATARQTCFLMSELQTNDDGKFRYDSGPDEGDVPYAQITDIADVVKGVTPGNAGLASIEFTDDPNEWLAGGETFQVLHGGVPLTFTATSVPGAAPWDVPVDEEILVGAVSIGDDIGWRKRWMLNLAGAYEDLYYPLIYKQITTTTNWVELVEEDTPDTVEEAEALCVERLLELLEVGDYHNTTVLLDTALKVGKTVQLAASLPDWIITGIEYELSAGDDRNPAPGVVMKLVGKNYEETPQ